MTVKETSLESQYLNFRVGKMGTVPGPLQVHGKEQLPLH